jgi:hypothetical protein
MWEKSKNVGVEFSHNMDKSGIPLAAKAKFAKTKFFEL